MTKGSSSGEAGYPSLLLPSDQVILSCPFSIHSGFRWSWPVRALEETGEAQQGVSALRKGFPVSTSPSGA